jgi:hypothetical protein
MAFVGDRRLPETITICALVLAGLAFAGAAPLTPAPAPAPRRMSFHNRILFNRAAVAGLRRIDVMIAAARGGSDAIERRARGHGGRVRHAVDRVDYVRIDVPIEHLLALVSEPAVEAYQISSLSNAAWFRDAPPEIDAEMIRAFETTPVRGVPTPPRTSTLPVLSPTQSRDAGYTADDDTGVESWRREHPTYDGRGVTVALVEAGNFELAHPAFTVAKSLDGSEVPKIAGILNGIGLDDRDETRVELRTPVHAATTWREIDNRTYTLPRAGTYRFGLFTLPAAPNLVHQFGVLRDDATGDIWVDTDGDSNFQDETPAIDVNVRMDRRALKLTHPAPSELSFVVARGPRPDVIYIYVSKGSHQTMTMSIVAGSDTPDNLARGVAPGARLLVVRASSSSHGLHNLVEAYLLAAARADVDLIVDSMGIFMGPDTSADFMGVMFNRIVEAYGKPVFRAAGNQQSWPFHATPTGDVITTGVAIGARSFAALWGTGHLEGPISHFVGSAGPSIDGQLEPDVIAPINRVVADLFSAPTTVAMPRTDPTVALPPGYRIGCCTSASSPYAAGVAALLLSAAKQEHRRIDVENLARALRVGARFLSGFPPHQQGHGLIDVSAAWRELQMPIDIPVIRSRARIVHPLVQYAARGSEGVGIVEVEGWTAGMRGERRIELRRETGSPSPVTYRISLTGNDGTFSVPAAIALPLHASIQLPVTIDVRQEGAHSVIVNLHDPAHDRIVFRTQAMIVAAERADSSSHAIRFGGTLPLMLKRMHYVHIPDGVTVMAIDLDVVRGAAFAAVLPGHMMSAAHTSNRYPIFGRTFPPGRHTLVMAQPVPGPWTIDIGNVSAARERAERAIVSAAPLEYVVTVRLFAARLNVTRASEGNVEIAIENAGALLREPIIEVSAGRADAHRRAFLPNGQPHIIEIEVAANATALHVRAGSDSSSERAIELHLYDCTTGECFSHDFTLPAAAAPAVTVRKPRAGRWVAAINPAPFPAERGGFVLDTIVATRTLGRTSAADAIRTTDAKPIRVPVDRTAISNRANVIVYELIDAALQRDEDEYRWETRPDMPDFRQRPAAIGTAVLPLAARRH